MEIVVWSPIAKGGVDSGIRAWGCSYTSIVVLNVRTTFTFTVDIVLDLDFTSADEDPCE